MEYSVSKDVLDSVRRKASYRLFTLYVLQQITHVNVV